MSTERSQAILLRDSQSTPLRSRLSVKPHHPDYDAHVLAHIKAKVVIDPVKGCWLWQGFVHPMTPTKHGFSVGGYGTVGYRGRSRPVHRVVWTILKGAPPKKMDVCHECDVRHCCNPDHLWLGTRRQNMQDMAAKGRGLTGKKVMQTECLRGHPLSGDNLYLSHGGRRRGCLECDKILRAQPKYVEWRRAYQRIRRGWTKEEAHGLPPVPAGQPTARRSVGARK